MWRRVRVWRRPTQLRSFALLRMPNQEPSNSSVRTRGQQHRSGRTPWSQRMRQLRRWEWFRSPSALLSARWPLLSAAWRPAPLCLTLRLSLLPPGQLKKGRRGRGQQAWGQRRKGVLSQSACPLMHPRCWGQLSLTWCCILPVTTSLRWRRRRRRRSALMLPWVKAFPSPQRMVKGHPPPGKRRFPLRPLVVMGPLRLRLPTAAAAALYPLRSFRRSTGRSEQGCSRGTQMSMATALMPRSAARRMSCWECAVPCLPSRR